ESLVTRVRPFTAPNILQCGLIVSHILKFVTRDQRLATSDELLHASDRLILMSLKTIQLGQVRRSNQNGQTFLVTKLYNEVFAQYAILRQADGNAANTETVRVKVQKDDDSATLPGYTYTQDAQDF